MGRLAQVCVVSLFLSTAVAPAGAQDGAAVPQSGAYRVTSTLRSLSFPLPGGSGQVALSPDSSVVIDGRRPAGPWRVTVENGEAAMTVQAGTPAAGSVLGGTASSVRLDDGTSVFWKRVADHAEGGALSNGRGTFWHQQRGEEVLPAGKPFTVRAGQAVEWKDGRGGGWLDRLSGLFNRSNTAKDSAFRLPVTVPPSPDRSREADADARVHVRPLALGTATVSLPTDRAIQAEEKLTKHRDRMMLTTPGKGMSGPALYMDFSGSDAERQRNVLMSGGKGSVQFFMKPDWKVTLAPNTTVELEKPLQELPGKATQPKVKLTRGAMMYESQTVASTTTAPPQIDGVAVSGESNVVMGNKQVVFATPTKGGSTEPAQVVGEARGMFQKVKEMQGPDGGAGNIAAGTLTLMGELPASQKSVSALVPLQADLPGANPQVDVTMLSNAPTGPEAAAPGAMEAYEKGEGGIETPVALVVPVLLPADPGADPEDLKVVMVPATVEGKTQVNEIVRKWEKLDGLKKEAAQRQDQNLLLIGGVVVLGLLLLVGSNMGRWLEKAGEIAFGVIRRRCQRCELILDHIPLVEVGTHEPQLPIFALLGFDNLTDTPRQNRAKGTVLTWGQKLTPTQEPRRFRLSAQWCQRCLEGTFLSEVVSADGVMDESARDFTGADTRDLVLSLSQRKTG